MAQQWCLSSSCDVGAPTHTVKLIGSIFTRFCTLGIWGDRANFHEDRPKGTTSPGALNTRGVGETGQSGRLVANLVNGAITCIPINNNE